MAVKLLRRTRWPWSPGAGAVLAAASRWPWPSAGAKVVVNDLGATLDGQASGEQPAQEVVETIRAAGGEAIVDGGSVADWNQAHQHGRRVRSTTSAASTS
jgi:hypothetical protein